MAGVPRDFWLEPWEKEAIIAFHLKNPLGGHRRPTFMMLDADVRGGQSGESLASVEASWTVIAVEDEAVTQGAGFEQPPQPHQHWHVNVSYINLSGTFYTYAVCWTDTVVSRCIGISGSR